MKINTDIPFVKIEVFECIILHTRVINGTKKLPSSTSTMVIYLHQCQKLHNHVSRLQHLSFYTKETTICSIKVCRRYLWKLIPNEKKIILIQTYTVFSSTDWLKFVGTIEKNETFDADPIGNVRSIMKHKLKGTRILKIRINCIQEIWNLLPVSYIEKLIERISRRYNCQRRRFVIK